MTPSDPSTYLPKLIQGLLYAALGVLVIWAIAIFAGARENAQVLPGTEEARAMARHEIRSKVDEAGQALHEVKWIDKEKGSVHLTIDRAMELVAGELTSKEPRATNITVAWVAPQMPDYSKTAVEGEAGAPAKEAAAPAAETPAGPAATEPATAPAETQPAAPQPEGAAPPAP